MHDGLLFIHVMFRCQGYLARRRVFLFVCHVHSILTCTFVALFEFRSNRKWLHASISYALYMRVRVFSQFDRPIAIAMYNIYEFMIVHVHAYACTECTTKRTFTHACAFNAWRAHNQSQTFPPYSRHVNPIHQCYGRSEHQMTTTMPTVHLALR